MALTNIDVCNAALGRLGAATISALDGASVEALQCAAQLDISRRALLRMHPWKFAKKYANLTPVSIASPTALVVGGQYVIKSVAGDADFTNVGAAANLVGTTFTATGTTPTAWGTGSLYVSPPFGYSYQVALPSDWIRNLKVNDGYEEFKKVGILLYCDTDTLSFEYIYDCDTYTAMDAEFIDCLAQKLAINICVKITNSSNLLTELKDQLKMMLPKAKFDDSTEDTPDSVEPQEWLQSRISPSLSGYPRDPRT